MVAAVWRGCEEELARSGAFDFDDLLTFAVRLLREHPIACAGFARVGDGCSSTNSRTSTVPRPSSSPSSQDPKGTSPWWPTTTRSSTGSAAPIPATSSASPSNIHEHSAIVLAHNFRSRVEILDAATRCVAHNERRVQKTLMAVRGEGGRVEVRRFFEDWNEAHWVAGHVADAIADAVPGPEILILARTGYATQAVQLALARAGIPHRVLGSLGLYERAEVKDALAYLILLVNAADAAGVSPGDPVAPAGSRTSHREPSCYARARGHGRRPAARVRARRRTRRRPVEPSETTSGHVRRWAPPDP